MQTVLTKQSYHNLFKYPIIPEILIQISLKYIHTLLIDNPPRYKYLGTVFIAMKEAQPI